MLQVLVTCHSDGTVRMLDAANGQVIAALQTGGLSQARCAPGGKLIVQRGRGDMICLDLRLVSASPSLQLVPWGGGSQRCVLWSSYPQGVQGRAETAPWSLAVPARGSVVAGQERGHSTMHLFDLATGAREGSHASWFCVKMMLHQSAGCAVSAQGFVAKEKPLCVRCTKE